MALRTSDELLIVVKVVLFLSPAILYALKKTIRISLLFLALYASVYHAGAQMVIRTVAGIYDSTGTTRNGGTAINAHIGSPSAVALDASGNLYVAEYQNHVIRKILKNGTITTIAGVDTGGYNGDNIPATSSKIHFPSGIAVDAIGNIYISDEMNYRVRKIDTSGIITTFAGVGVVGNTGNGGPGTAANISTAGLTIDHEGNLLIADNATAMEGKHDNRHHHYRSRKCGSGLWR